MKIQRDLTTVFYIAVSGVYLIVGTRSFAEARDTPETSYFYLVGLLTWVVAALAWMQQPDNRAARISYLMSLGFMSACSVDATFSVNEGTLSSRIVPIAQFIAAAILPCLFLHCFAIFPSEKRIVQHHTWLLKILYVPGVVLVFAMTFLYFSGQNYDREFFLIQLPSLEGVAVGFLFLYSTIGQLLLLHTCFAAPSASQRRQARWLLLGIVAGTLPQAIFLAIPRVTDISIPSVRFSAYTLCLIPTCYVVAIIRHRLMNIELIINRSVVYTLVSGFALVIYLLCIQGLTLFFHRPTRSWALTAVSVLTAALLFAPAKTRIQKLIDRAFDREAYNYRQTLLTLSQTLHSILDLEILVYTLLRQVTEAMHISRGVVMQRTSSDESQFLPEAYVGMEMLPTGTHLRLSQPLVDLLKSTKKPLDFTNIPFDENSIEILNIETPSDASSDNLLSLLGSAVWIPFVTRTKNQENLVGLLVLGEKLSEEPYTQSDLDLLGILAHQGATAVENATLYAQLNARTEAMEQARKQLMATYLNTYGGIMPANGQSETWFGNEMGKDLVSDFNNISDALKDSHDQLMQLDRLKSQFLDNVSHELRTPLTHIKGFVDNMLDGVGGKISEKQKDYLLRVEENCDRLIRLINDLLDLSRIESGKMTLQLEPLQLRPILEEAVDGMQSAASQKGICVRLDCPPDVIALVDTDKMKQILTNLLDNAVKYTGHDGRIQVCVAVPSKQEIQVCIEDTGGGIPDTDVNLIFDRFHRATNSKSSSVGGIGLGLPIVKNLVELHGGRIWAKSEIGKGSRFYLTLKRDSSGDMNQSSSSSANGTISID